MLFELIIEPVLVALEAADESVRPGRPTTPWLVEARLPATPGPVGFAVFKVPPVALPAVFTTLPAVDAAPLTNPLRAGEGPDTVPIPLALPLAIIESSAVAAEAAACELVIA